MDMMMMIISKHPFSDEKIGKKIAKIKPVNMVIYEFRP
jgi:hypothetical protein